MNEPIHVPDIINDIFTMRSFVEFFGCLFFLLIHYLFSFRQIKIILTPLIYLFGDFTSHPCHFNKSHKRDEIIILEI